MSYSNCPGHFGHIELSTCSYNPITFKLLYKLLQSVCFCCHKLRANRKSINLVIGKLKLIRSGYVVESTELDDIEPDQIDAFVEKCLG